MPRSQIAPFYSVGSSIPWHRTPGQVCDREGYIFSDRFFHLLIAFGTDAVMQGNNAATVCACPFLFFFKQESFCANRFDSKSVLDQTDLISQPVPFVNVLDAGAGKRFTFRTKINPAAESAIPNLTFHAIGRLAVFLPPASRASPLFPEMRITGRAIQPTRRQHLDW